MPSICPRGTVRSTSRLTAVTIGRIMIPKISPPQSMSRPVSESRMGMGWPFGPTTVVSSIHRKPGTRSITRARNGSRCDCRKGART